MGLEMSQRENKPVHRRSDQRLRRLLWDYGPIGLWLRLRPLRPLLEPERLAAFIGALAERRHLPGAILEVGCYRGATAAEASRMLKLWDTQRRYVCIDTFSGFVPEQFAQDELLGLEPSQAHVWDFNSRRAVERTFRHLGHQIDVIEADIVTSDDGSLPDQVSVCLLDVDLESPINAGLEKVYPRMVPGGIVLVDDCEEEGAWRGARRGYRRFVEGAGLPETYDSGFGVIELPGG